MSYVVLARKWRPMSFADLVGQDHVARTLGNAIKVGRVAHAFLFTGVRGVGKTTSARILAKALNCMGDPERPAPDSDPGPTVEPCLRCPACLEIAQGRDVDVQEIDGASYNGVDEVRKLQDSLPYRPSRDRFKIVIVDEVHMLTSSAWNAFLKTLEEPPPHVKFIFATTEVHKLPITILSRVQRFDFKMIPVKTIAGRIRHVLAEEGIRADDTAVALIARQAAGSMRDAMSLLDQVIAFSGTELRGDEVAIALGAASRSTLTDLATSLALGDPEGCLRLVGDLSDQGFDIQNVAKDLLALLRDLVIAKVVKNPTELLDLSDEELARVLELAAKVPENELLRLHQGFSKSFDEVARGSDPRAALEMLLVRLALRPQLLAVDELLHRIGHLEKRLSEPSHAQRTSGGGFSPRPAPDAAREPRTQSRETRTSPAARSERNEKDGEDGPAGSPPPDEARREAAPSRATAAASTAAPSTAAPSSAATSTAARSAPALEGSGTPDRVLSSGASRNERPTPSSLPEPGPSKVVEIAPERAAVLDRALGVFDALREENPELAGYFEQTTPLVADETVLELGMEAGYLFEKQIDDEGALAHLERVARRTLGPTCAVRLTKNSSLAREHETLSAERARRKRARHERAIQTVKNHPKIQAALRIFGGEIKSVFVPES